MIPAIRVPSKALKATAAVIIIHGLGDQGSGWKFLSDYARQTPKYDGVRFIFPNAPTIPISGNGGMPMPAWFDLKTFPATDENSDHEGFMRSYNTMVRPLIQEQIDAGISPEKIILGGFSQGGAMSLLSLALLDIKIGGFLVMSGFCPVADIVKKDLNTLNIDTKILQCHGTADQMITPPRSKKATDLFVNELGFKNLTLNIYPGMAHSTCEKELVDIFEFFDQVLL